MSLAEPITVSCDIINLFEYHEFYTSNFFKITDLISQGVVNILNLQGFSLVNLVIKCGALKVFLKASEMLLGCYLNVLYIELIMTFLEV